MEGGRGRERGKEREKEREIGGREKGRTGKGKTDLAVKVIEGVLGRGR